MLHCGITNTFLSGENIKKKFVVKDQTKKKQAAMPSKLSAFLQQRTTIILLIDVMKLLIEVSIPKEADFRHNLSIIVQWEITFQAICNKISIVLLIVKIKKTHTYLSAREKIFIKLKLNAILKIFSTIPTPKTHLHYNFKYKHVIYTQNLLMFTSEQLR